MCSSVICGIAINEKRNVDYIILTILYVTSRGIFTTRKLGIHWLLAKHSKITFTNTGLISVIKLLVGLVPKFNFVTYHLHGRVVKSRLRDIMSCLVTTHP